MKRVAVLDRDGTINVERHYLSDPAQLELTEGAAQGLRRLLELGLELIVITNQSGVGRGYFSEHTLALIHERLETLLGSEGVRLAGIYVCPHVPADACRCRKPATALLERAARERAFDPRGAFVIGDKACDVELGRRAGSTTLLVRGPRVETPRTAEPSADYVVEDLRGAARVIEGLLSSEAEATSTGRGSARHGA